MQGRGSVLVHLGAGIGNIVLATPLLIALNELGFQTDLWLAADYPDVAGLLAGWCAVRNIFEGPAEPALRSYDYLAPALPPFYWSRYARLYLGLPNVAGRPADEAFYRDEQEFYFSFARRLGYGDAPRPWYALPVAPVESGPVTRQSVVLAPGCKTGEMALKRWPHFAELAGRFDDVVIVGTADDLHSHDGRPLGFPPHVRSLVGELSLRQTAELMASAGAVVANDSGLAHVAGACGTPTIVLFGPTPDGTLGRFPPNVTALRTGLPCEPCWFGRDRFGACNKRMWCLQELDVDRVAACVSHILE